MVNITSTQLLQSFHSTSPEVQAEHIRTLYKQTGASTLLFVVLGGVFLFALWDDASHNDLIMWAVILITIIIARCILWFHFLRRNPPDEQMIYWGLSSSFLTLLTGTTWGATSIFFLPPGNESIHLTLITVILIGCSAAAVVALSSFLPSFFLFNLSTLGTLIIVMLQRADSFSHVIALLSLITLIASSVHCINVHKVMDDAFRLGFEKEKQRASLRAVLQSISQGISVIDKYGKMTMWNPQFLKLLHIDSRKLNEDPEKPEKNPSLTEIFEQTTPPLKITDSNRTEYVHSSDMVLEVVQSPMPDDGSVCTYTDISEIKNREIALEKARIEAERAKNAQTRFLAAASHDLRQPIHALWLFYEALAADRAHDPETSKLLEQMEVALKAVDTMLNSLLDISKLDAGVVKPTISPVNLGELFKRLNLEYQPIAQDNKSQLKIRPTNLIINSDQVMLERVLHNLISNALRYTKNGRVLVAARRRNNHVSIEIHDTGIGIPEDQINEIFVEFHQLEEAKLHSHQGLGLGLAIVKRLCQLLDHRIKVTSQLRKGSCFTVTVPISNCQPLSSKNAELPNYNGAEFIGRNVLVIDDDKTILSAMDSLLSRWGCRVITATSKDEASRQIIKFDLTPDLMIIDYRLQAGYSGIEAATQLRNALNHNVSTLIITGDTAPDRLREAEASGYPLLHKPVQPAKLRNVVRFLLKSQ